MGDTQRKPIPQLDWSHLQEGAEISTEVLEQTIGHTRDDPRFAAGLLNLTKLIQQQRPDLYISGKRHCIRALTPDEAVAENAGDTAKHLRGVVNQSIRFGKINPAMVSAEVRPNYESLRSVHGDLRQHASKQLARAQRAALFLRANNQTETEDGSEEG